MIFTARQLEELQKAHGQVALPRGARLTPLGQDWLRSRKIGVVFTDLSEAAKPVAAEMGIKLGGNPPAAAGQYLWWCDGPCGMAKAALSAYREASLSGLQTPADAGKTIAVVKEVAAAAMKCGSAAGAILFVQSSAMVMVGLNRCASVRAVMGTTLQTVDQAIRQVGTNVLVIEYGSQTLQQMKNLIGRFVKGKREMSPEVQRMLQEVASCG